MLLYLAAVGWVGWMIASRVRVSDPWSMDRQRLHHRIRQKWTTFTAYSVDTMQANAGEIPLPPFYVFFFCFCFCFCSFPLFWNTWTADTEIKAKKVKSSFKASLCTAVNPLRRMSPFAFAPNTNSTRCFPFSSAKPSKHRRRLSGLR